MQLKNTNYQNKNMFSNIIESVHVFMYIFIDALQLNS